MNPVNSLASLPKQERIIERLRKVMLSGQYAEGDQVREAEAKISDFYMQESVAFNSCGSGLFAVFRFYAAMGYQRVVVQNNTFYATAAMAHEAGLEVVLCDTRPDDPSMSLESLRQAVQISHADLVCLTHVGGWLASEYGDIADYCASRSLPLIEDCAHVFGLPGAGSLGDAAVFSFYPTKSVPIGEGGVVVSEDEELVAYLKKFRAYGKSHNGEYIEYDEGFNLRMSEFEGAILCVQVESLQEIMDARRRDAELLHAVVPCLMPMDEPSTFYKFIVSAEQAQGLKQTGKVYALTDQTDRSMGGTCWTPVPLFDSKRWALQHACLPVGEDLFKGMSPDDLRKALKA